MEWNRWFEDLSYKLQIEDDGDVYFNGSRIGEGKYIRKEWLAGFFFFFFWEEKL